MQVKVEKTEPCKAHVSFTVPADEFAAEVRQLLTRIGRQANMKGFRPGKVPASVIEQLHGTEVRKEARQAFVQKAYEQAVGENDLRPFSHPRVDLDGVESEDGKDFEYGFELTLRPDFELGEYKGLAVETSLTPASDEEVDAAIAQVRQNQAHPEPAGDDGLPEDGMALCKVELLHEGEVVFTREGLRLGVETSIPGVELEAYKAAMNGKHDGESAEVPVTFPDDFEVEAARGTTGVCRITVNQAFKIVQPSDEELYKLLEVEDEAALKTRVREKLEEANADAENQRVEGVLLAAILDAHEMELPGGMVEEQTRQRVEQLRGELAAQGIEGDALEEQAAAQEGEARAAAERSAKAFFVIEAISQAEDIKVQEAEIKAELQGIAQRNRSSLDEVVAYYRDQQLFPQLQMEILERKVRAFLRENADLKSPTA